MAVSLEVGGWRAGVGAPLARVGRRVGRAAPRAQAGGHPGGGAARAGGALPGGAARAGRAQGRLAAGRAPRRRPALAHAAGAQPRAVGRGGGPRPVPRPRGRAPGGRGRRPGRGRDRLREEGRALGRGGAAGKVENCQAGVFLAYGSRRGHALSDRRLHLPEAWAGDAARRRAAKVPEGIPFLTKPEIAREMIARALDAGVPCAWVLGDEVYGADRRLRAMLEERGRPYVLAIRSNDRLDADLEGGVG